MGIALAVFDLDGTLVHTGNRITERTAAQVAALVRDGLPCALASARLDDSLAVVNEAIGVPLARISYNGALVRLSDGTIADEQGFTITRELAEALAWMSTVGAIDLYLSDDRWLAFGDPEAIEREQRDTWCRATSIGERASAEELVGLRCRKILAEGPDEQVAALGRAVAGIDGLNLTHSGMGLHDIWPSSSGKGNALAALCRALGITPGEVVACGDSDTDVPMLELAGTSVVVQPCSDGARAVATHLVTDAGSDELFATLRELAGLPPLS